MTFPHGFRLEQLSRAHPRKEFKSGVAEVDQWLSKNALQNQDKHLSTTRVLLDEDGAIAGYYTLATGQVDFSDLPSDEAKKLPKRMLPVAVLAWLGVSTAHQSQGLGRLLLAHALRDCYKAGRTFAFIAVVLDCINDAAKSFYLKFDFQELPGHPYRLFLSAKRLEAMMGEGQTTGRRAE
jgi:GNAT superfamily N-acetyltransferase